MNEQHNAELLNKIAELETTVNELRNSLEISRKGEAFWTDVAESRKIQWAKAVDFIQASIDREEWTADELQEIFWEELASLMGLNLQLTEEIEVTVTLTYSGTVTVPRGTDVSDIQVSDEPWNIELEVDGESLESSVTFDEAEVSTY